MTGAIKNKRNHGIIIFENSIKGLTNFIIPFAVTMLPAIRSGKTGSFIITLIAFLVFFGADTLYAVASWFFKTYSVENGVFTLNYGVFVRKNREIPVHKIVTVHEMQTVTQRIFKAWTLKLDTGNSLLNEAEARLVVSQEDLETIRCLLKSGTIKESCSDQTGGQAAEPMVVYRSSPSSLVKMGLTSNALFAGLLVIFSLFQFLTDIFDERIADFLGEAEDFLKDTELQLTVQLLLTLALVLLAYSVFSLSAAAISSLIKYHDFKVLKSNGSLTIQYGLFKRNSFTIPENKIQAVYLKQSIIRQCFGLAAVYIESVGYGNEKGEEALLIPLIGAGEAPSLLSGMLGDYPGHPRYATAPKRALRRFIVQSLFFPLLLIIPISLFYPYGFISLTLIPFFAWSAWLKYRNSGIAWDEKSLFLRYGGFTRVEARVKRKGIQAVMKKASPFQKAAKLFTLNVSIQGNVFGKTVSVRHMDESLFTEIERLV